MPASLNRRCEAFAERYVYTSSLATTSDRFPAGVLVSDIVVAYCAFVECSAVSAPEGCRVHRQSMALGVSRLVVEKRVVSFLSRSGRWWVKPSPEGVLRLAGLNKQPAWLPAPLVAWAVEAISERVGRRERADRIMERYP